MTGIRACGPRHRCPTGHHHPEATFSIFALMIKAWYGYGFMVSGKGTQRQFGHEGGAAGENAALIVIPAEGFLVVGLSNLDQSTMGNMVNFVAQRLPRAAPPSNR